MSLSYYMIILYMYMYPGTAFFKVKIADRTRHGHGLLLGRMPRGQLGRESERQLACGAAGTYCQGCTCQRRCTGHCIDQAVQALARAQR